MTSYATTNDDNSNIFYASDDAEKQADAAKAILSRLVGGAFSGPATDAWRDAGHIVDLIVDAAIAETMERLRRAIADQ